MKKKLAVLLLIAMVFALAACGSQNKGGEAAGAVEQEPEVQAEVIETDTQEPESAEADVQEEEIYEGIWAANPWVDSDRAGVLEATGFDMEAPAEAANVAYSYMPGMGMAQLNYTMENAMWVYRMQPTHALEDISGIYCEWDYTSETKVAGMEAMEYSYAGEPEGDTVDCMRVINWYDEQNQVTYSLSVMGKDLNGMDTAVYAENLFNPAVNAEESMDATESDAEAQVSEEDLYNSYLGLHVSTYDGSEILVEEDTESDRLKVSVSIFRLCSLDDGIGVYEDGIVSFVATDPNGNHIRCSLYYNDDNSLCMRIEESTWSYLPDGTVIEGFDS